MRNQQSLPMRDIKQHVVACALALTITALFPLDGSLYAQDGGGCELTPSVGAVVPAGELSGEVGLGVVGAGRVSCPVDGRIRAGGGLDISVFPEDQLSMFLFQFLVGPELQIGGGLAPWSGRVALEAGWSGTRFLGSASLISPPRFEALTSGFTTGARLRASRTLGGTTRGVIGVGWRTMFFEPDTVNIEDPEELDPATTFPVTVGVIIDL